MDDLLKKLTEKIDTLKIEKEQREEKIKEIKELQAIINTILKNPFNLYDLDEKTVIYLSSALSLDNEYFQTLARNKVIYDGYLQFGRDAVPQISLVEDFVEETRKSLTDKKYSLVDEVANTQESLLLHQAYTKLLEELTNPDTYVSNVETLITLLDESSFEEKYKNDVKLEIISKNNRIYQMELANCDNPQIRGGGVTSDEEIQKIEDGLQEKFGPETFHALKSVSNLLSSCKTREEIETIMQDWKFVFDAEDLVEVIDGLVSLKRIETLLFSDIVGKDLASCEKDIKEINLQVELLNEYKESLLTVAKQEAEAIPLETDTSLSKSKLHQALDEYSEDPLSTPNCVLFLSDSIERDIKSISDRETLEDIFLLIEQLKNNNISHQSSLLETAGKDVYHLKPTSMGRQARVAYTKLTGNMYGIVQVFGKKADRPKSDITTLKNRVKSCNFKRLKKELEDPQVLDYYVERTKMMSSKLKEEVATKGKGSLEKGSEGVRLG